MAIEGPLRELSLSDVFQLLELSRKTGVLTVRSEARERPAVVRFERGAIVGAQLPEEKARLGHLLVRSGKMSELDMERVLRQQRSEPGLPFGTLAARLGVVSAADVKRQLAYLIEETVFELVRWKDGYFRFEETAPQLDGVLPVRIPTQSLLMEAARRMDEWSALATRIPHTGVVPVLEAEEAETAAPLDLEPHEWEVLAEIDGERTLKQIAAELGRSDFEVAKTVYGLLSTRIVGISTTPAPLRAAQIASGTGTEPLVEAERALREGRLADARQAAEQMMADEPQHSEAHLVHGRILYALGRWAEAVESLGRAVRLDPLAAHAHLQLGFAAARAGEFRRAEQAWTTYLRLPDARGPQGELARRALQATAALRAILEVEDL